MKTISKLLLSASLLTAMVFSFYTPASAQLINEEATAIPTDVDPISATLDSLVNLTYVQRLNSTSIYSHQGNTFMPNDVPTYSADIYQKRMEKIQTPIPLCYNSQVKEYIDMYAVRKRGLTERVMGLSNFYFPMYEQILDQQGLPLEFKYLSIVESALNPTAVSRVGATGLWQFMLGTGKLYNLKINSMIDERRDPEKATLAACQYFKDMYAIYNDWLLVIAAYNCGPGNVNRAIARSGGKHTFWEIAPYLPKETRGYVPAFIAVTYLMSYPAEHNLTAVQPVLSYFQADTVLVDQKVSLKSIADATNTPIELLTYLNPVYKRGVVPDADEQMPVRLPANKINSYIANLSSVFKPEDADASALMAANDLGDNNNGGDVRKIHKVKRGEHLQTIANRYSCSVAELKKWNHLRSTKLVAGQRLTVYVADKKKSEKLAQNSDANGNQTLASKPDSKDSAQTDKQVTQVEKTVGEKVVFHTVAPGDTLWKIAQRYQGITVEQLKQLNNLQSNELKVGTKLKVLIAG
ncbi:MAG: LysM peptidoglycan-binding domain-containing protein [Bacteroidetes bacterium]|nr:LysM peptidoglycan-binding domain-containing protein [Bacteroidota bacterium]